MTRDYVEIRYLERVHLCGPVAMMNAVTAALLTSELVSENLEFPASTELTGNFIEMGLGSASIAGKTGVMSERYGRIPYASEQGIYFTITGN